jgi:LPXTG-motif cell wall-anchored protein
MKTPKFLAALILCLGVSALTFGQGATVQRETKLAVSEPTMVGNTLLDAGSYTLRVHDYQSEKVTVVITRDSDSKTMGTVIATRMRRNLDTHEASDNQTQFTYTTYNGHPAVDTWYYPGDEWGEKFAYGKETMASTATGGDVRVTQTPAPTASTSTMAESTAPAPAPVVEERHEETRTAEVAPAPAPAPEPVAAPERTLPKTASSTPLVALLGALSLAGAAAVRFSRKAA